MIAIDYNFEAEKLFKEQLDKKNKLFSSISEYCEKFVKIKDKKAFQDNISNEFIRLFVEKYRNDFPPIVSNEKMFQLAEVDLNKLRSNEKDFNDIIIEGYDFETSTHKEMDFSIKTTNENQKNEFIKLDKFTKVLNDNKSILRSGAMYYNQLSQILNNSIVYDHINNKFKVNTTYIQFIR